MCDFRAPKEPVIYDSSAGACAVCGLLEIADSVPEYERELYFAAAVKILKAMEEHFADWSPDTDFMIHHATGSYHNEKDRHVSMIYGDYFFAEAVYKPDNRFLWAVQWHPEFSYRTDPSAKAIFSAFVQSML